MKIFLSRAILVISLLLNYTNVNSQGIRLDGICYSGINNHYSSAGYWGLSYDQNFGEKLSLSLSFRTPFSSNEGLYVNEVQYGFRSIDGDVHFTVYHINDWQEFAYTSKYFFSDNSDGSYFVSSGISLMLATNTYNLNYLDVDGNSQSSYGDLAVGEYEQSITLIPFALDLGHRSEFDGFYLEYYVGAQFLLSGANTEVEPASLANHGVETRYSSASIHAGLCLGFSWVK